MPSLFPLKFFYFVAKNFYYFFYSSIVSRANIIKYGYIFYFPLFVTRKIACWLFYMHFISST